MYCPNCGAQNKKHRNYCRYCGLHLQDVEKMFLNQLVFGEDSGRLKKFRGIKDFVDYIQVFLLGAIVVGALLWIFSDTGGNGRSVVKIAAITFFLMQGVREILGYFQRQSLRNVRRLDALQDAAAAGGGRNEFAARETNKLLGENAFVPASSIAEDSTELLLVEKKTTRLE